MLERQQFAGGPDNPSAPLAGQSHLDELRRRAELQSQAARDAIARALGTENAEKQLSELRNGGGQ